MGTVLHTNVYHIIDYWLLLTVEITAKTMIKLQHFVIPSLFFCASISGILGYECHDGWHKIPVKSTSSSNYYERCFYLNFTEKMDMAKANLACEIFGGNLVSGSSYVLDAYFYEILGAFGYQEHNSFDLYWLGAMDFKVEGEWRWLDTDHVVEDYYWMIGQPSNTTTQNCLAMETTPELVANGTFWRDYPCEREGYVAYPICMRND